jgi:diaminopimelate epimerase
LCGNATLCSTAMAVELQLGAYSGFTLLTDAGLIASRLELGVPEIDFAPIGSVARDVPIDRIRGERRIGFALAGVPHLVVLVDDLAEVDLPVRGAELRHTREVGTAGANVNFVAPLGGGIWAYRTFERGVEGETLACGTGSVAVAVLLAEWELATSPVTIRTTSGRDLVVRFREYAGRHAGQNGVYLPSLKGEGRTVYRGTIEDLRGP